VFAIVFDLDTSILEDLYHNASWKNAYQDIRKFLEQRGFDHMQGSTYFGDETMDSITCSTTVQEMALTFDWFASAVRDIRMLKIEDNNDMMPAIDLVMGLSERTASKTK